MVDAVGGTPVEGTAVELAQDGQSGGDAVFETNSDGLFLFEPENGPRMVVSEALTYAYNRQRAPDGVGFMELRTSATDEYDLEEVAKALVSTERKQPVKRPVARVRLRDGSELEAHMMNSDDRTASNFEGKERLRAATPILRDPNQQRAYPNDLRIKAPADIPGGGEFGRIDGAHGVYLEMPAIHRTRPPREFRVEVPLDRGLGDLDRRDLRVYTYDERDEIWKEQPGEVELVERERKAKALYAKYTLKTRKAKLWAVVGKAMYEFSCVRACVRDGRDNVVSKAQVTLSADRSNDSVGTFTDKNGCFAAEVAPNAGYSVVVGSPAGDAVARIRDTGEARAPIADRGTKHCEGIGTIVLQSRDVVAESCPAGFEKCGGDCVHTGRSNVHCGGCGVACASGTCSGGVCIDATGQEVAPDDEGEPVQACVPSAEVCDGEDNDCNGEVDDGLAVTAYFADTDGDGFGDGSAPIDACMQPAGYVNNGVDCDDTARSIRPGADEQCDGLDNDCDGDVDEGLAATTYYADTDGDTFGDPNSRITTCDGSVPAGYVRNQADCDDKVAASHPGAPELCDGLDNDCDGDADEGLPAVTHYADIDGDGYGDPDAATTVCDGSVPAGTVTNADDCDDGLGSVNPGASEVCNDRDDDCDGSPDNGLPFVTYHRDVDGDGYGDPNTTQQACDGAPSGYVLDDTDCDDDEPTANPDETETCDGIDNDCNGQTDEGVLSKLATEPTVQSLVVTEFGAFSQVALLPRDEGGTWAVHFTTGGNSTTGTGHIRRDAVQPNGALLGSTASINTAGNNNWLSMMRAGSGHGFHAVVFAQKDPAGDGQRLRLFLYDAVTFERYATPTIWSEASAGAAANPEFWVNDVQFQIAADGLPRILVLFFENGEGSADTARSLVLDVEPDAAGFRVEPMQADTLRGANATAAFGYVAAPDPCGAGWYATYWAENDWRIVPITATGTRQNSVYTAGSSSDWLAGIGSRGSCEAGDAEVVVVSSSAAVTTASRLTRASGSTALTPAGTVSLAERTHGQSLALHGNAWYLASYTFIGTQPPHWYEPLQVRYLDFEAGLAGEVFAVTRDAAHDTGSFESAQAAVYGGWTSMLSDGDSLFLGAANSYGSDSHLPDSRSAIIFRLGCQ